MELEHQYITVNDVQLHYVTQGEGPLMILLHGFPEFWYSWRKQIPAFAKHYRVVAPDMRGYNLSEKPEGVKHYRMELLMKDIVELIHALGEEKAIIVAHDWGGAVAWMLAGYHPEVVEKLIVLNMSHPAELKKQWRKNIRQVLKSWYVLWFQIPYLPELFMRLQTRRIFEQSLQGWAYNPDAFTDEDIDKYVTAFSKPGALRASINYYRASARYPTTDDGRPPQKVAAPVFMIWGENDKALVKELTYNTQYYCEQKVKIKYIRDCSHWVQHEYPRLVNQYILDYLGK